MQPSISELKRQFDRALKSGWIPLIRAAADQYEFTTELLLGIGSRETNLDPQYQQHPGDHGHGFSLWQIDIGSYREWILLGEWKDVAKAVMKAASVLDEKRTEVKALADNHRVILSGADLERITVAAYNHGANGTERDFEHLHNPDRGTTGGDYSADVVYRRDAFAAFLNAKE